MHALIAAHPAHSRALMDPPRAVLRPSGWILKIILALAGGGVGAPLFGSSIAANAHSTGIDLPNSTAIASERGR